MNKKKMIWIIIYLNFVCKSKGQKFPSLLGIKKNGATCHDMAEMTDATLGVKILPLLVGCCVAHDGADVRVCSYLVLDPVSLSIVLLALL